MSSSRKGKALAKVPIVGGVTIVLYAQAVFDAVSKKDTKGLVGIAKKWLSNPAPATDLERCELVESCLVGGTQFLLADRSANALKLFDLAVRHLPQCAETYFKYLADAADHLDHGQKGLTKAEAHHLARAIRTALNLVIETEEEPDEEESAEAAAAADALARAKTGPQKPVRVDAAESSAPAAEPEAGESGEVAIKAADAPIDDSGDSSGTREAVVDVAVAQDEEGAEEEAEEDGEEEADEESEIEAEEEEAEEAEEIAEEDKEEMPVARGGESDAGLHDGMTQSEVLEDEESAEEEEEEEEEDIEAEESTDAGEKSEADGDDTADELPVDVEESEDAEDDAEADVEADEGEAKVEEAEAAEDAAAEEEPAEDEDQAKDEVADEAEDEDDAEEAEEKESEEKEGADGEEEPTDEEEEADADADDDDAVHDLQSEGAPADEEGLEMAFEGIEMDDDDEREATRILPASEQAKEEEESTDFDFPNRTDEARYFRMTTAPRVSVLNQAQDIWMDVLILHVPRVNDLIEAGKRKRVTKIAIRQFRSEWKAHRRALIRDLSGDAALQFHEILIRTGCRFIEGVKVAASTNISQSLLAAGEEHMAEGQLDDAIKSFRTFLMHDPCDDVVWYNLGCCYEAIEDYPEARRAFDACLAINPTDPDYFLHAGQTAVAENRRMRGHAFLSRAFTLDPELSGVREKLEEFDGPLPEQQIEREEIHFDRELFRTPDQWPVLSKGDQRRDLPAADSGVPKLLALYQAERFSAAIGLAEELVAVDRLANAALLGASCYLGMAGRTPDMSRALPLLRRAAELATMAERERAELFEPWRLNLDAIRGRLRRAAEIYKLSGEGGLSTLAKAFHQAIGSEVSLMPAEVSGTGPKPKPKVRDTGRVRPTHNTGVAERSGKSESGAGRPKV